MDFGRIRRITILSVLIGVIIIVSLIIAYPAIMKVSLLDLTVYIYFTILLIFLLMIITPLYIYWENKKESQRTPTQ